MSDPGSYSGGLLWVVERFFSKFKTTGFILIWNTSFESRLNYLCPRNEFSKPKFRSSTYQSTISSFQDVFSDGIGLLHLYNTLANIEF